jgi:phosphopantothenoylcysteine decarboxylase/phosphopantothenate--cysteine ligase
MESRRGSRRAGGLTGKRILLIVTGGIAAYKSAFLVRALIRGGAEVRVVMSEAASKLVTPLTFEVLSGNPVPRGLFARREGPGVEHVELASWAERVIVAPATADFLAKAAIGLGDDLASTVLLAARCPVLFAPSMNDAMWRSAAVRRNIGMLAGDGAGFIEPGSGELACGDLGPGRMAEPEEIIGALEASFAPGDLDGARIVVTAGRTEEDIDPVRYISNRSSGRMGFAIAAAAKGRGAHVTLVHGPVDIEPPGVDSVKRVRTAAQMKSAVARAFPTCDVLFMAAAVSDYAPDRKSTSKLRRTGERLEIGLRPTEDILASVAKKKRKDQIVVGFALETGDAEEGARKKIREKRCDYLVLNVVGKDTGFAVGTNQITLFKGVRKIVTTPVITKEESAAIILDRIVADLKRKR